MKPAILEITTAIQIQKPISEVFEGIVDPAKMSNYFISKSSGRMEEGKTLQWEFPEFQGAFPVRIKTVKKDQLVAFNWDGQDGKELQVEITLEPKKDNSTLVSVSEKSMENNEAGIQWLKLNTAGWANFLACMKAYLEYGINLRKGGFDFMSEA